jgi:diguanylate cyclase (GGDEF) domain
MTFLKTATSRWFSSLQKRLIGALSLIVLVTIILQFVSQNEAFSLRRESEALVHASANAENAGQFAEAVADMRIASNRGLVSTDIAVTSDIMTDAAITIGEKLGKLRAGGMELYAVPGASSAFSDLDQHIDDVLKTQSSPIRNPDRIARIEERNAAMGKVAHAIAERARDRRDAAQKRLIASIARWQLLVAATGLATILVVSLVLFDLIRNILPALRHMHRSLQRLADGDLDLEIGSFRLRELQALSGPLETFRQNARAVKNLAFTDAATGLPNRRAFEDQVGRWLTRDKADRYVCMLVDIDRFKHINDDYGHAAGDELVRLIAMRMEALLGEDGLVARVGGDEFAVCTSLCDPQSGAAIASLIVEQMRAPLSLGEYSVAVTVSAGFVEVESSPLSSIDTVMRSADMALYASKKNGRNCATAFEADMAEERAIDRALEQDLEKAFEGDQLRMVYQPIHGIEDATGEVEALVRWRHPGIGEVPPSTFIPAAERSGLMVRLGEWIIWRALGDLAAWPDMHMSINLSPLQLQHDGFSAFLLDCCREHDISPRRLFLEVTESLSIERNTRALLTLNLLRTMGFRIALDDFGTGYSSLSMVKSFKFDRMKLDRSLVMDLGQDPASAAVLEAAVTMARHVGAEVVAEGISEEHLIDATRNAGCTHLQGYFYSKPIEAAEVPGYFQGYAGPAANAA